MNFTITRMASTKLADKIILLLVPDIDGWLKIGFTKFFLFCNVVIRKKKPSKINVSVHVSDLLFRIIAHLVSATDHTERAQPLSGEASDHVVLETRVRREGGPAVHGAHVGHVARGLLPVPDVLPVLEPGGELRTAVPARDDLRPVLPLVPGLSAVAFVKSESLD